MKGTEIHNKRQKKSYDVERHSNEVQKSSLIGQRTKVFLRIFIDNGRCFPGYDYVQIFKCLKI